MGVIYRYIRAHEVDECAKIAMGKQEVTGTLLSCIETAISAVVRHALALTKRSAGCWTPLFEPSIVPRMELQALERHDNIFV